MEKFYITSAIPYPNGKPHIGFGLEIVITDAITRYNRLKGKDTHFLTGTDEHGLKVYQSAQKEGTNFQEYVDRNSLEFARLKEILNISYDDFIRTTDQKRHWPGVEKIWNECVKTGKIYKKAYEGLYCVGCEEFKAEKDLENGLCPEHKVTPEKVQEENYFFKLASYKDQIKNLIVANQLHIIPTSRKNEVLSLLKDAHDFSVSRPRSRISWGVPVPRDETQTIYVWFDALVNYISAIGYGRDEETFSKWWPADVHVIGKGIARFHAIYWPAMLLAANLPLPKTILVHGYVTVGGEKISKSLGNVISPEDIVIRYGNNFAARDALRYFLLRYIPTTDDGNFSFEEFERVYNADLANGLGNLAARVAKLCGQHEVSTPKTSIAFDAKIEQFLQDFQLHEALTHICSEITQLDRVINEKKPWELSSEKAKPILENLALKIQHIAFNLRPFLPETAEKILNQFSGKITSEPPLFPRIN